MKPRVLLFLFFIHIGVIGSVFAQDYSTGLEPISDNLQKSLPQAQPHGLVTAANSLPGSGRGSDRMPEKVDLSRYLPPVRSQRQIGSCSAWSTIYYGKTLQENMERGWGADSEEHQFSPLYTYNQITGGRNQGTAIIDHMNLVIEQGVATWARFPYPYNLNARPDRQAQQDAARYKAESARSLAHYNHSTGDWEVDIQEIKTILAEGNVVIGGFDVYEDFQSYSGGLYKSPRGRVISGHAMAIVGYDDSIRAFRIVNSWGTDWGEEGFGWIDYNLASRSINWGCAVMVDLQDSPQIRVVPPTGLEISQGADENKIRISWDPVNGAAGYVIFRADNQSQELKELDRVSGNSYEDSDLPPGVTYLYTVASIVNGRLSDYSELAQGWTARESAPPGIPSEIQDYFNGEFLLLDWADLTTAESYRVYRWDESQEKYRLLGTTVDSGFVDKSLSALFGQTQGTYYLISGVNNKGEGSASDAHRVAFISPRTRNQVMERKAAATAVDDRMASREEDFRGEFHRTEYFDYEYTMAQFRAFYEAEQEAFRNWRKEEMDAFEAWKEQQNSWRN